MQEESRPRGETGVPPSWWNSRSTPVPPQGYADMVEAMRILQDTFVAAVPEPEVIAEVTATVERLTRLLAPTARDEWSAISGFSEDLSGRGSLLLPVLREPRLDGDVLTGRVRFGRFHLGGNGAVHGGAIPLLFDDVLGGFANMGGRPSARTAYLHVDYRNITPVGCDLELEARFVREEGRKRWMRGVLRQGDVICVEAEGLFVQLRPGQQ